MVAVIDWFSRYVLAWEWSLSLDSGFCVRALPAALERRRPEIFNTDQGCQYSSTSFTPVREQAQVKIRMDGKGRAFDHLMIERLWRTVNYEEVFRKDYEHFFVARQSLGEYFGFYNDERRHSRLDGQPPAAV